MESRGGLEAGFTEDDRKSVMIYWLVQSIAVFVVGVLQLIPFSDAVSALAEGVFSLTSTTGYSMARSILSYGIYFGIIAVGVCIYLFRRKSIHTEKTVELQIVKSSIPRKEWYIVFATIILFGFLVVLFRERVFDARVIYSEEFYNLSALIEFQGKSFDIIYPYSIGNLIMLQVFGWLGISSFVFKIILNSLALIFLYWAISTLVSKIKTRMFAFFWVIIFFVQPLISPSMHRNLFRFLLPALIPIVLEYIARRTYSKSYTKILLLILFNSALLFFGSADILALGYIIYGLHVVGLWFEKRSIRETVLFLYTPFIGVLGMLSITNFTYIEILKNQLSSIVYYSGYANTTPYLSLFQIFSSESITSLIKQLISAPIYYLPILVMGSTVVFIILSYRKYGLNAGYFRLLFLLVVSYILYFRQNLGDAGIGRIGIASSVLIFIVLTLTHFRERAAKSIIQWSVVFFILITLVSAYSFYYSALDLKNNYFKQQNHGGMMPCKDSFIGEKLRFAGFEWCDAGVIADFAVLREKVGDNSIYVYDDTFALYYILGKRPVALIPAYYMAYSRQDILLEKMDNDNIEILVYPKDLHFFGVPSEYLSDFRLMSRVNAYRDEYFGEPIDTPLYTLYEKK